MVEQRPRGGRNYSNISEIGDKTSKLPIDAVSFTPFPSQGEQDSNVPHVPHKGSGLLANEGLLGDVAAFLGHLGERVGRVIWRQRRPRVFRGWELLRLSEVTLPS